MQIDTAAANRYLNEKHGALNSSAATVPGSGGTTLTSPALTLDVVRSWTKQDVADWLENNQMGKCASLFMDHDIVGDSLLEINQTNLKDMNIATIGDRIRIERLVIGLRRTVLSQSHYPSIHAFGYSNQSASPPIPQLSYSLASSRHSPKPSNPGSGSSSNPRYLQPNTNRIPALDTSTKKSRSDDSISLKFAPGEISPDTLTALRKSSSIMNMDHIKQSCVRVTGDQNETRIIMLTNITDAASIMDRILKKFNIPPESGKFTLFVSSGGSTHALTDAQLVDICKDPTRPEREKLFLRKVHTPFSFSKITTPTSSNPPPIPKPPPASAIRHKLGVVEDNLASRLNTTPKSSASKLNKFFGERPPSELISSNLLDFFPRDGVMKIERRKSRAMSMHRPEFFLDDDDESGTWDGSGPMYASERSTESPTEFNRGSAVDRKRSTSLLSVQSAPTYGRTSKPLPLIAPPELPPPLHYGLVDNEPLQDGSQVSLSREVGDEEEEEEDDEPEEEQNDAPIKWLRGALIGQGSFGSVYMGLHGFTGELMAIKQVELPTEGPDTPTNLIEHRVRMVEALQHEISFLKEVKHEHIVRYLGSRIEGPHFNIFLEYVPGGSIHAVLQQWNALPEPIVQAYLRQVLLGLKYLHDHEIIHRDIKAANILVDNKGCVKISDFGISKRVGPPEDLVTKVVSGGGLQGMDAVDDKHQTLSSGLSLQGSVYWMSPEIVKYMRYTRKSDIWSVGCLVIEMFTADHPWPGASQVEAIFKIGSDMKPDLPEVISHEARDLAFQTFRSNYLERPSADELLRHPFLNP